MGVLGAIATMLHRAFHRAKRLRPLAILTPIPKEPGTVGRADNRHGAAFGRPDAMRQGYAILKQLGIDRQDFMEI